MKQSQLKKLAEWYGLERQAGTIKNLSYGGIGRYDEDYDLWKLNGKPFCSPEDWQPHLNSNQLDMLKKKFIEELRKKYDYSLIEIRIRVGRNGCYDFKVFRDEQGGWCLFIEETSSDNENECWLNAILNYVEDK